VEGEYVRVGAPLAGTLLKLGVERGQGVAKGARCSCWNRKARRRRGARRESHVAQAVARLANLEKGKRPDELAAIAAQEAQATAALALSRANLARQEKLVAPDSSAVPCWTRRVRRWTGTAPESRNWPPSSGWRA